MATSGKSSDRWIKVSVWCCEKQIRLLSSLAGHRFNKLCSTRMSVVVQGLKRVFTKKEVKPTLPSQVRSHVACPLKQGLASLELVILLHQLLSVQACPPHPASSVEMGGDGNDISPVLYCGELTLTQGCLAYRALFLRMHWDSDGCVPVCAVPYREHASSVYSCLR